MRRLLDHAFGQTLSAEGNDLLLKRGEEELFRKSAGEAIYDVTLLGRGRFAYTVESGKVFFVQAKTSTSNSRQVFELL